MLTEKELESLKNYEKFTETKMKYVYDTQEYIFWCKQNYAVTQSIYNRKELTCNSVLEK